MSEKDVVEGMMQAVVLSALLVVTRDILTLATFADSARPNFAEKKVKS